MSEQIAETSSKQTNESVACDVCGRLGAIELGDRVVCTDCYAGCGSCCSDIDEKKIKV